MIHDLMYIELKTGYADNGPAWIGYVKPSKSKKTVYFNDHAFRKFNGNCGNDIDIETGNKYWISGVKKRDSNRRAIDAYLGMVGLDRLPQAQFEIVDMADRFPLNGLESC